DELAEDAGVPADHRDRRPFGGAPGVPVHERREAEDEPGDPRHPVAGREDALAATRQRLRARRRTGRSLRPTRALAGVGLQEVGRFHRAKYGHVRKLKAGQRKGELVEAEMTVVETGESLGEFVDFLEAGAVVKGEFTCSDCAYGV